MTATQNLDLAATTEVKLVGCDYCGNMVAPDAHC